MPQNDFDCFDTNDILIDIHNRLAEIVMCLQGIVLSMPADNFSGSTATLIENASYIMKNETRRIKSPYLSKSHSQNSNASKTSQETSS